MNSQLNHEVGLANITAVEEEQSGKAHQSAARQSRKGRVGRVPAGDCRLMANIRQDLHLKLKIAAASRRTTIGELLEGMIAKHLR